MLCYGTVRRSADRADQDPSELRAYGYTDSWSRRDRELYHRMRAVCSRGTDLPQEPDEEERSDRHGSGNGDDDGPRLPDQCIRSASDICNSFRNADRCTGGHGDSGELTYYGSHNICNVRGCAV